MKHLNRCAFLMLVLLRAAPGQLTSPGNCLVSTNPIPVRTEGLTETIAEIYFSCSGYTPGSAVAGNFSLSLPVNVSNRVDTNNLTSQAVFAVDTGAGLTPSGVAGQVSGNTISFGVNPVIPASGNFNLKISNVRAAVNQLPPGTHALTGLLSVPVSVNTAQVSLGTVFQGLYATSAADGIPCFPSPAPDSLSVSSLFDAGTNFVSTRMTEGFASAFTPRGATEDNGTRFLLTYTGFPAGTHLYLPDMLAGSDALIPTAGGDLGLAQATGQYFPSSGTLLLVRVAGAASDGSGGMRLSAPTGGPAVLNSASEVLLTNGSGYAVYEVADSNPVVVESVQFPTFISAGTVSTSVVGQESVALAAISTTATASAAAPMPRFTATVPPVDCTVVGDCSASYFPKLSVNSAPIQLSAIAGLNSQYSSVLVLNSGGGALLWQATTTYQNGSGWLVTNPPSGVDNAVVSFYAKTAGLAPGTYHATVLIDAGPLAGNQTIPISFTVQPVLPSTPVTIGAVVNAATFEKGPVVSGSLATIFGVQLAGNQVSVAVDGEPATVLYDSATQINFQIPPGLGGRGFVTITVTVDGTSSTPADVLLAPAFPEIFPGGVLNQDYSVNSTTVPASSGSVLQIFATGIPDGATVAAQIGNQLNLVPQFAGAAPGLVGVQQVNVRIPAGLSPGVSPLIVCAAQYGAPYCSDPYLVTIK